MTGSDSSPSPSSVERASRWRAGARGFLRAVAAVLRGYRGERISLRAAALTYFSIFSLVPLATVALVMLETLHQQAFHDRVHAYIQGVLAPGVQKDSLAIIEKLLATASSRALKGIGFLTLAVSAGSILKNLDQSLNDLWNIAAQRTWGARLVHYALALTVGPLLLALSLAGTAGLRHTLLHLPWPGMAFLTAVIPVLATALGLTFLYVLVPHTRVELRPALAGALLATVGWELAKHGYAAFAAGIFRYNALYGSLGAIPLFLLWVYVSWVLVLFGARLAFALQHADALDRLSELRAHPRGEELLAFSVARELARAELQGLRPIAVRDLARRSLIPEHELVPLLKRFLRSELVHLARGKVALARDPRTLRLDEVRALFATGRFAGLPAEVTELARALERDLTLLSWADLAGIAPAPPPDEAPSAAIHPLRKP